MTFSTRRAMILHPFLLAVYPVLLLCATNNTPVLGPDTYPLFIATICIAVAGFGILTFILKDKYKSANIVTVFLFFAFSYGHIYQAISGQRFAGIEYGRHRFLLVFYVIAFAGLVRTLNRSADSARNLTRVFNWIAFGLLIMPVAGLARAHMTQQRSRAQAASENDSADPETGPPYRSSSGAPDLYYIILDGYGSAATLRNVYNYDNSAFLDYLRSRGFFVAEDGHSNYSSTFLSLASSLNMTHVNDLALVAGVDSNDESFAYPMIANNRVSRLMKARSYRYLQLASGWSVTNSNVYADEFLQAPGWNEFQAVFLRTTILNPLMDFVDTRQLRSRVLSAFDTLSNLGSANHKPFFIFAHIVSPHPPFIFDATGGVPSGTDGAATGPTGLWKNKKGYVDQLSFINQKVRGLLDAILAREGPQPIIILQGDHGPASVDSRLAAPSGELIRERMGILEAILVPVECRSRLYPGITPVNVLRTVLNCRYGTHLQALEDRVYYSRFDRPYDFADVTALLAK